MFKTNGNVKVILLKTLVFLYFTRYTEYLIEVGKVLLISSRY